MSPLKPNWSRTQVFNPAWVANLAPVVAAACNATIEVYFLATGEVTYDPVSGAYVYPETEEVLYEGPARVQPIRMARNVPNNASDTEVQAVRIQIPEPVLAVRPKHKVRVLEASLNPTLESFEYVVQGVMSSSNPFDTVIEAQVDTEVDTSDT